MGKSFDDVFLEIYGEEVFNKANELNFDSCMYWQDITDEQVAKMSQEEYDDFRGWIDACVIFNLRFIRDEKIRLIEGGAPDDVIKKHDERTINLFEDIARLQKEQQDN